MSLSDKKMDTLLNINTRGTRNPIDNLHNRYEATPYSDLNLLFDKIPLKDSDYLVDFGSGKGRVCFYVNHLFNCKADGIEANIHTYHESLLNLDKYLLNKSENNEINFTYGFAEEYQIKKEHNIFFFFNPFSVQIFKKVLKNINESLNEFPRQIKILLAYPVIEYVSYILDHTDLVVVDYIEAQEKKEKLNKFLILSNE